VTHLHLRQAAQDRDILTRRRLDRLVPRIMEETDVDCWILVSREYADDPVVMSMLPATWLSSRRRTILVFARDGEETHRFSISRYRIDDLFESRWDPTRQPDQWQALAEAVREFDPATIALNRSASFAHADGLTASEHDALVGALGSQMSDRLVSGENLAVSWLECRLPEERAIGEEACRIAHGLLRRALSNEAVTPGETTTTDLEWWLRDRVQETGTVTWFHPTVTVQGRSRTGQPSPAARAGATIIMPGDLVHIDFGIVWKGLCTDQQQHAYVLADGESSPPVGLSDALSGSNRLQEILLSHLAVGRTGNDVLRDSLQQATYEGLIGRIYTHPIGIHGHGAGPSIGLWDQQDGVPGPGDRRIRADTMWSIELMTESSVPEWDHHPVQMMLEEDVWLGDEECEFLDGRQEMLWVIE
jgi:Xaa-Pro aminopeptidase